MLNIKVLLRWPLRIGLSKNWQESSARILGNACLLLRRTLDSYKSVGAIQDKGIEVCDVPEGREHKVRARHLLHSAAV